jgi:hypothetical protein
MNLSWEKWPISMTGFALLVMIDKGTDVAKMNIVSSIQMREDFVDEILRNKKIVDYMKLQLEDKKVVLTSPMEATL